MEIRKNNDIKFRLILVDNHGNPVTNIKDVKCTVVNSGAPHFHSNHFHFKHWYMYRKHDKFMQSIMCGYDHPYNVLPVNMKEYCVPFVEDKEKPTPGTENLPVMVNPAAGIVEAYFAARKQKTTGKYNLIAEIQCWDPTWADGGVHTHTVQIDNVVTLTDGENITQVSPCVIDLNVVIPHGKFVPTVVISQGSYENNVTPIGFMIPSDFLSQGTSIDFKMKYNGETLFDTAGFDDDEGDLYIRKWFSQGEFDNEFEALEFERLSSGDIRCKLRGNAAYETDAVITILKMVVNGVTIYP